ncbi:MAG TPA: LysR family transcriptional regulator [Steroidobacteraceae bacterium]|jgi:DNA-binding transcriptional LysR family regulator|nr:LysR family transcriptional regulator [Steroidobacteraceae bacterium]
MLNKTNLARIDLNLLVLFEAVLEERHVARAAARLHVSPSAVSHGLGRLRALMQDPLFLRQPKGVVPTERARELAAPVADILERARQVIARAEKFDPRHSVRRFVIGAPDAVTAVVLPPLLGLLRREAPGIDLGARNLVGNFDGALAELDQRTLDVALLPISGIPGRFAARTLFGETDFVIVRRAGHPLGRRLTLSNYCEALHLVVSASADLMGMVDRELARRGLRRRVVLTVSNFSQALSVVAESDLVAAMPRLFAARYAPRYRAIVCEPPFPIPSEPISAIAPQAAIADAGLAWLMDALQRAAKAA